MKQTGGHGQYAVCNIEIEPLGHGEGFVYDDKIFGGAIPHQFIPSIEKGIVKTMAEGVLSGNPMVDIKVTLVDGKFHPVDSSRHGVPDRGLAGAEGARSSRRASRSSSRSWTSRSSVPEAYTGDIMGDLNAKRGKIAGMEQIGGGKQRISAQVPQAEVARYVIDLRSMTGGRGAFSTTFSHYEEMPQHLAQKVIDEYQAARPARKPHASASAAVSAGVLRRGTAGRRRRTASGCAQVHDVVGSSIDHPLAPSSTPAAIRCDASGACPADRADAVDAPASARRSRPAAARRAGRALLDRDLVHRRSRGCCRIAISRMRAPGRVVVTERRPDLEQQRPARARCSPASSAASIGARSVVPPRLLLRGSPRSRRARPRPARAPTPGRASVERGVDRERAAHRAADERRALDADVRRAPPRGRARASTASPSSLDDRPYPRRS